MVSYAFAGTHFESPHAILGLLTYIFLLLQATGGVVQFYFPNLVGGEGNGKALYKYHRIAGYTFVLLLLSSACLSPYSSLNSELTTLQPLLLPHTQLTT
jgi:hypothetical protein